MLTHTFLTHLHRGGAVGYYHALPERKSLWFPSGKAPPVPRRASNWYFGVHPCTAIPPCNAHGEVQKSAYVRAQKSFIAGLNCLYAEFDVKTYGSKQAIRDHLEQQPISMPSVLVDSGGGFHAYWLLAETFAFTNEDQREAGRIIQQLWVATVGGDPAAHDLTRILRVPGTLNYKYDPPRPVGYVYADLDCTFSLRELTAHLPPIREPEPRKPIGKRQAKTIAAYNEQTEIGALLERYGYRWRGTRRMISPDSGSGRDGVSIDHDTNRCFVHTGGDPLCDGYWKRPFDVFRILGCQGDFEQAIKEVRDGRA